MTFHHILPFIDIIQYVQPKAFKLKETINPWICFEGKYNNFIVDPMTHNQNILYMIVDKLKSIWWIILKFLKHFNKKHTSRFIDFI